MLRVVEAFSGIGSQRKALSKLGIDYEIINTVDWDISEFYAYDIIHNGNQNLEHYNKLTKEELLEKLSHYTLSSTGKAPVNDGYLKTLSKDALERIVCAIDRTKNLCSITDVHASDLPDDIDLFTYSFPCQDLSRCGSWHGNFSGINRDANNRSGMLWEVERILKEFAKSKRLPPKFLLMENVSNIESEPHVANFIEWQNFLGRMGYENKVYTLNSSDFGSPQQRIRTYMISVFCPNSQLKSELYAFFFRHNLETFKVSEKPDLKKYFKTDYTIAQYKEEADISNPNDTPSRRKILEDNEIIYDGRQFLTNLVNTLTTKQDRNPCSGIILYPEHTEGGSEYRNFTPRECFLLMGFDEDDFQRLKDNNFNLNASKKLYGREKYEKLAGNSIVVEVLFYIFKQIIEIKALLENVKQ